MTRATAKLPSQFVGRSPPIAWDSVLSRLFLFILQTNPKILKMSCLAPLFSTLDPLIVEAVLVTTFLPTGSTASIFINNGETQFLIFPNYPSSYLKS